MNKLLIGTAAIALFASPALAAPIGVTVGGYYNSMVYNVDSDNSADYKDLSLQEDAEIIFKGKGKFNSGLEYGFQVQLEAASKDDQIDEHYIYVKGSFGKVEIGAENSAAFKSQVTAPKFLGWKTYDNNFETWSEVAKYEKPLHDNYSGDANKINYYSPRISGLQFVYSMTPSNQKSGGTGVGASSTESSLLVESGADKSYDDVVSMGLNYKGTLGGMKVKASYTTEKGDYSKAAGTVDGEHEEKAYGLSLSSGNFTIGGHKFESDEATPTNPGNDWDITTIGVSYKLSKATTIGFALHEQEDDKTGASGNDDTDITVIGGSTKIGSGATFTYSYEMVESNDASKGDTDFIGAGLLLKF
ncbi:MAG: porin [Parvibaculales bacterium]|jgi:outer membrane protein OmpU